MGQVLEYHKCLSLGLIPICGFFTAFGYTCKGKKIVGASKLWFILSNLNFTLNLAYGTLIPAKTALCIHFMNLGYELERRISESLS